MKYKFNKNEEIWYFIPHCNLPWCKGFIKKRHKNSGSNFYDCVPNIKNKCYWNRNMVPENEIQKDG